MHSSCLVFCNNCRSNGVLFTPAAAADTRRLALSSRYDLTNIFISFFLSFLSLHVFQIVVSSWKSTTSPGLTCIIFSSERGTPQFRSSTRLTEQRFAVLQKRIEHPAPGYIWDDGVNLGYIARGRN